MARRRPLEELSPAYRRRIERGLARGLSYTEARGKGLPHSLRPPQDLVLGVAPGVPEQGQRAYNWVRTNLPSNHWLRDAVENRGLPAAAAVVLADAGARPFNRWSNLITQFNEDASEARVTILYKGASRQDVEEGKGGIVIDLNGGSASGLVDFIQGSVPDVETDTVPGS